MKLPNTVLNTVRGDASGPSCVPLRQNMTLPFELAASAVPSPTSKAGISVLTSIAFSLSAMN